MDRIYRRSNSIFYFIKHPLLKENQNNDNQLVRDLTFFEGEKYSRKEFSYELFQRSFQLSREAVDADNNQAKYENGVLRLSIPIREEVKQKPLRLINIS